MSIEAVICDIFESHFGIIQFIGNCRSFDDFVACDLLRVSEILNVLCKFVPKPDGSDG